jgi:thiol-disulfide isomerase/thioredoxin
MGRKMINIETMKEWDQQISQDRITVALFTADWCPDCRRIKPFMPEVEEAYQEKLTLISVDCEKVPQPSEQLNVFGIPSFIAFLQGKELIRFVSKLGKTREEIENFLHRALQVGETLKKSGE